MSLSSKTYFRFAQEAEESMNKEVYPLLKKEYRKVAYKGENGNKFITVKEFAQLCQHEIN